MSSLLNHWKAFRGQVVPRDAGSEQVEATRNAFYGGAAMVLLTLDRIAEPDISEDEGVRRLEGMKSEIKDHMKKYAMKHGL